MTVAALVLFGVLGLVAGSAATSGIHRLADPDLAFWRPGPRCPHCHHTLGPAELVPILSWAVSRGRCRHCDQPFGWAYPAVELLTAGLFVAVAWRRPDAVELIPLLILSWALVVASVTDLYVYLIPNRLVFPALLVSAGVMVPLAVADDPDRLVQALLGMVLYFLLLFVPHLVHPAGMGMGDVKLSLLLGLHLGYTADGRLMAVRAVVLAMLVGSLLGVIGGFLLWVVRRAGWDPLPDPLEQESEAGPDVTSPSEPERGAASAFPFGPSLSAGCLIVILAPAAVGLT